MAKLILNNLVNLQNETTVVTAINSNNDAIEAAMDQAVFRNGSSPNQMNADFDMNSHRILNLPAPIFANDVVRLQDTTTLISGLIPNGSITNAKLAAAPAYTVKGNPTSTTGPVTDIGVSQLQWMTGEGLILAGTLLAANMNTTADQAITLSMPDQYSIFRIIVSNPSLSLTTAVGGFYTGAGKTGLQIVANSQVYSGLTNNALNNAGNLVAPTINSSSRLNITTLYFSLTTPQGTPSTADIYVYAIPLYSANLNPTAPSSLPARVRLNAATSFYVATTGNDANAGTLTAPWATLQHAYTALQSNYDLSGQTVTINVADGTYAGITGNGPVVGQVGAPNILFKGNIITPGNCIINGANGYAFGAAFGARFSITGFKVDFSAGGNDMLTTGQGGEIWILNTNPGSISNVFIFGTSAGIGFNDMSAAFGGRIFIDTWVKYTIDSTGDAISTTGTWVVNPAVATQVVVPDASAIKLGMAVRGTGLYGSSYVVSKVGNTLTLNGAASFAPGTGQPITLTMSRQNHADAGAGGVIIHNTNGTPGLNAVDILGNPHYNSGFLLSNGAGCNVSFQTIAFTGTATGPKFTCKSLGVIDTLASANDPATYLPGDSYTKTASFAANTTDITISSNGNPPSTGTEVFAGNLVCCTGKFRSPRDSSFGTITSEMTTVDYVKGSYSLGTNNDLVLTRPSIAAGSSASITFVGCIGTGGQYN